jgi:hypothetical protein
VGGGGVFNLTLGLTLSMHVCTWEHSDMIQAV